MPTSGFSTMTRGKLVTVFMGYPLL